MLGLNQSLVQYKKYVVPPDPLEKESKVDDMVATNRYKRQRAIEYYEKLMRDLTATPPILPQIYLQAPQISQDPEVRASFKHAIAVKINELINGTIDSRIDDLYVEEFHRWLLGKSKFNVDKNKTPWGPRMLIGDSILAYIREFIGKKKDFEKKLVQLKITGPPMTIEHAWLYFKYIVTEADPEGTEFLPEWNWWLDPDPNKTGNNRYIRFGPNFIDEQPIIRDGPPNAGAPGPQPPRDASVNQLQINDLNRNANVQGDGAVIQPDDAAEAAAEAAPANVVGQAPAAAPAPPEPPLPDVEEDRRRVLRDLDNQRFAEVINNVNFGYAPAAPPPPEVTERQMEEARAVVNAHAPAPVIIPEPNELQHLTFLSREHQQTREEIRLYQGTPAETNRRATPLTDEELNAMLPPFEVAHPEQFRRLQELSPPPAGPVGPPPPQQFVIIEITEEEDREENERLRAEGVLPPLQTPEQAAQRASEIRNLDPPGHYNEVSNKAQEVQQAAQNVNRLMKEFNDNKVRSGENPLPRTENQISVNMKNLAATAKSSAYVNMRDILELGGYDKNLWTQVRGMTDDITILEARIGFERSPQQRARLEEIRKEEENLMHKTIEFMTTYRNIHNDIKVGSPEEKIIEDFKKEFRKLNPLLISHLKVLRAQQFEISEHMEKQHREKITKKEKEVERQASIKSKHKQTIKKLENKNKDLFVKKMKFAGAIKKGEDWKESFIEEFNEMAEDYNKLILENPAALKAQAEDFQKKAEEEQKLMKQQARVIQDLENYREAQNKREYIQSAELAKLNKEQAAAQKEIADLKLEITAAEKISVSQLRQLEETEAKLAKLDISLSEARRSIAQKREAQEQESKNRETETRNTLDLISQEFIKRFQPDHAVPFQFRTFDEFIERLRTFPIRLPGPPAPVNDVINDLVQTTIEENGNFEVPIRKRRRPLKYETMEETFEARKKAEKEARKERRREVQTSFRKQGVEAEVEIEEETKRAEKEERKMEKAVKRFQMEEDADEELEREEREQKEAEHMLGFEAAQARRRERKNQKAEDIAERNKAEQESEEGFNEARAKLFERRRQKAIEKEKSRFEFKEELGESQRADEIKAMKFTAHQINTREAAREIESEEKKKLREERYALIRKKEDFEREQERKAFILEEYADVLTREERAKIYTGKITEELLKELEKRKKKNKAAVSAFEEAMAINK